MVNFKFTIFTPCYNGEKTIQRVFSSMENQTYNDFEWIIINDGSKDNSDIVIQNLIKKSPIKNKIQYISQDNLGKHRTWNKVVDLSTGEIFLPADADDSFIPSALEYFNRKLNELIGIYGTIEIFSGINVCVYDPLTGKPHGSLYPKDGLVSDNVELAYKYKIKGEHWGCLRTDLLKKYKFPEIEGHFYTENRLWFLLAKKGYKVVCYNDCLRAYYFEDTSLTHSTFYKWDFNSNFMMLHFHLWVIYKLGSRIFRYSPIAYFNHLKKVITNTIKCICAIIINKRLS